jgi:hypothetical protein
VQDAEHGGNHRRKVARADGVDTRDPRPVLSAAIRRNALRSLVEAAHGLPFAQDSDVPEPAAATQGAAAWAEALARAAHVEDATQGTSPMISTTPSTTPSATTPTPHDDLRPAISSLLARIARRAEPELLSSLTQATAAWDQADAFAVIDDDLEAEIAATRRRLAAGAAPAAPPARRAIALEGLLAVDAAVALVRLFERRLAALLRLRLRAPTPDLLPAGRPFLDLSRALGEVAEAWR